MQVGLCLGTSAFAQLQLLQEPESAIQLSFNRQNNFTFSTQLNMAYRLQKGKYRLETDIYVDNIINTRRKTAPIVQFYVRTNVRQFYQLGPKLELASWLESDQFWNTFNQRYSLYGGVRYNPTKFLSVMPLIGYSWDYRSQILDQGITPALLLKSRYDFGDGLLMETRLLARTKYISPRHQRNINFRTEWSKTFSKDAGLVLGLHGGSNEMDDYQSQSIQRIKSDTLEGNVGLQYRILPFVFWESHNQASWIRRAFDYDVLKGNVIEFNDLRFKQIEFYTRQKLSFSTPKTKGLFSFEYQNLGRAYELDNSKSLIPREYDRLRERERQKDYFRRLTRLELTLRHQLAQKHSLAVIGSNRYVQYDSPSEENFDDHDELSYGLSTEWRASWSRRFSTRYRLLGNVRRYAFLLRERSQDNYTQRSLRLDFSYRWDLLDQLSLKGEQLVYVTYHVKDFEDRNFTNRSTRNMESRINLDYRPKPNLDMELNLYRRELHVSYLNWEAFAESPLDTTFTYIGEYLTHWQLPMKWESARLQVDAGYKHFSQIRHLNTSMISLQNILTPINLHIRSHQTGPVTGLRFIHKRPGSLELSVWWQLQYQDFVFREIDSFTTLSANYREEVLRDQQFHFRPFVKLQANVLLRK